MSEHQASDVEEALSRALGRLAPSGVAIGCRAIRKGDRSLLLPQEAASISAQSDGVRDASGAARHVARGLIGHSGMPPQPILRAASGAPLWPRDIVGSMAHDDVVAVAAVAHAADHAALGIDVEPAEPLPDDVAQIVRMAGDVTDGIDETLAARLLFAAKEAVYKSAFPRDGIILGFEDIAIDFPAAAGRTVTGRSLSLAWISTPRIVVLAFEVP
jgi:4'-phosphopantetheinyl transferase EntD